jgi:hypothetical protein
VTTDAGPTSKPAADSAGITAGHDDGLIELADVRHFVDSFVAPAAVDRVTAGTGMWCDQWDEHPDVLLRLAELAASRTSLVPDTDDDRGGDPVGIARWWVDIFDRHIFTVCAVDGPLQRCRHGHVPPGTPLGGDRFFESVQEWFDAWFAVVWTRRVTDLYWCDQWQEHPEVYLQMIELWTLWEAARLRPGGLLGWWEQAHRTLAYVTCGDGPFADCKLNAEHRPHPHDLVGRKLSRPGP